MKQTIDQLRKEADIRVEVFGQRYANDARAGRKLALARRWRDALSNDPPAISDIMEIGRDIDGECSDDIGWFAFCNTIRENVSRLTEEALKNGIE